MRGFTQSIYGRQTKCDNLSVCGAQFTFCLRLIPWRVHTISIWYDTQWVWNCVVNWKIHCEEQFIWEKGLIVQDPAQIRRHLMIRNAIQRLMYGRYGNDQLNICLVAAYLILYLLYMVTGLDLLYWVSLVVILVAIFRLFSRNHTKRRAENSKFLQVVEPVVKWYRLKKTIMKDKEHCYFKCPSCGQQLRVPKGKGRITVTCRGCGASFEEKSWPQDARFPDMQWKNPSNRLWRLLGFFVV